MFKAARWRSEKNKVKVVFKLQFHAAKVPHFGDDALMISVVPADVGKPTVKSDKASVRDGSCIWDNPVYESVKFNRDPKSGKIHERIYYFVVGTGSSKAGVLGEASIDFSNYAEATKVCLVSLPLKNSKTDAVLNVSIQRMQESIDQREVGEIENTKLDYKVNSLKSQLDNGDKDETVESNSDDVSLSKTVAQITKFNGTRRGSSGSDLTISSSDSSSGVEIPWQPQMKPESVHLEPVGLVSSLTHQGPNSDTSGPDEQQRSQWEWLGNSCNEVSTDDSSSTPRDAFPRHHLDESSDIVIEKLKSEVAALSRQSEMSELELQTLRKQIVKESKRGQDLFREVVCLKEERDVIKGQFEKLKVQGTRSNSKFEGGDSRVIVEELRQELNHARELNANLRVQLQKTQESNSELILAVRDLDELLEQKNKEILVKDIDEKFQEAGPTHRTDDDTDDEEQKALEDLVKEHGDTKEAYLLEQQIIDMRNEIEIYKRDRDEFEMQMEQLALDYEIMKQENHEMAYKLEQSELQEQLKLQYECTSSYASAQEFEAQIENLENELKRHSKESADALVKISELEAHVKSLEDELEKKSQGFADDLDVLMQAKVEQEQRAIRAEETLRKTRWQNGNTADRLQDEFKRLSVQMVSAFEANEKLATKAVKEADELQIEKARLEEIIRSASEEYQSEKDHYEDRLHQLSSQVKSMTDQIEQMQSEVEDKTVQILKLENEVETCMTKNKEEVSSKETLLCEIEQMRSSIKEMELLVEQGNDERMELENRFTSLKSDAEDLQKELNKMRSLVEEKELVIENLQSELGSLQSLYTNMKCLLRDNELENEELRKQNVVLKGDLKKTEDALSDLGTTLDAIRTSSKEAANLEERIKSLEGQIELKESALDTSSNAFLEKEMDLRNKIKELEERLEVLNHHYENEVEKVAGLPTEEARKGEEDPINANSCSNDKEGCTDNAVHLDELTNETTLLKERNKLMEAELKEMQERYSEISLKFAEVEGERQQLVMKVRNLKNRRKS